MAAANATIPRLRPSPPRPLPLRPSLRFIFVAASPPLRLRTRLPRAARPHPHASSETTDEQQEEAAPVREEEQVASVGVVSPGLPARVRMARAGLGDQVFFLLAFVAVTTSLAFTSMVAVAIPTLLAMRRAAISFTKLADTTLEELPSTMAAVRLSGMEISDLTLELTDLSQEISDGVNKSAKVVQAVEAGIGQMGTIARQQAMSIIEERANLTNIPIKPAVAGAARRTSHVVGQAKKSLINLLSGNDKERKKQLSDRVES